MTIRNYRFTGIQGVLFIPGMRQMELLYLLKNCIL